MLLLNDYPYTLTRSLLNSSKRWWQCSSRKQHNCIASAVTVDDHIIKTMNEHNHKPEEYFLDNEYYYTCDEKAVRIIIQP